MPAFRYRPGSITFILSDQILAIFFSGLQGGDILAGSHVVLTSEGESKAMSDPTDIRVNIQKGEVLESPPHPSHLSEEDVAFETGMLGREINGRFEILKVLGHGGFGSVFLAHQKSVDRKVAIKILRPSWSHRPQVAQRFLIEAKATSQLQNQHTVTVFDFGTTEEELLYIAMEYLEGQTLHQRLVSSPSLTPAESVTIVGQVAESLAEAHDRGIVHRDLKPENVLLLNRENGETFVKVLDFGIARSKELSDQLNLTQTGQFSGTPAYMSPEVIRSKSIGPAADVYSLGILLYQMLTGTCPFEGDNPFDVLTQHVSIKPKPMRNKVSTLPVRLDIFVQKCLSKKAQKRPHDAKAFLKELRVIERTESLSRLEKRKGGFSGKATASAATIAVVEETEDAIQFSQNILRWARIWINANPVPATMLTVLFGVSAAGSMLFLDSVRYGDHLHQPIAAAATYFPPVDTGKATPTADSMGETGNEPLPIQEFPVDSDDPTLDEEKVDLLLEEPGEDELEPEEVTVEELLGEEPLKERGPDEGNDVEEAEHERPKKETKRSRKSGVSKAKSTPTAVKQSKKPGKNMGKKERDAFLLGESDSAPRKPQALDKVDAFLD